MFHPLSLMIPILVLIPNLIFFRFQPKKVPAKTAGKSNPLLQIAEVLGRIGVFLLPLLSIIHIEKSYEVIALIVMLISILVYYTGWVRYFRSDREYKWLFAPMLGIPVPLAIGPVTYFLSSSVILHSPYMFVCSLIFGFCHITISQHTYNQGR